MAGPGAIIPESGGKFATTGANRSANGSIWNIPEVAHTPTLNQANEWLRRGNAAAQTSTIQADADMYFPQGTVFTFEQSGAGQLTIVAAVGVTIRRAVGLKLAAQYAVAQVRKVADNEWVAFGALIA